jgi:tRNA pseudouridine55 synthase
MTSSKTDIKGILIIDKPPGMTSHDVVEQVRSIFKIRQVGHTGTLDPFATGVMVLCLGRATRVARYFEGLDKAYRSTLKLGVVTDTGDGDGIVQEVRAVPELSPEQIESALQPFRGTIAQQPPAYSAVKVAGERLYVRARRGEEVSAPLRQVTVRTLQLESLEGDEVTLFVECSKGTYIRSLAYDIGQLLGCGAHCSSLVRTTVGPFAIEEALGLEDLEDLGERGALEKLLGLDEALSRFLEPVRLTPQGASFLAHGRPVEKDAVARPPANIRSGTTYRALDSGGELIALVEAERRPQGVRWIPTRVLATPI